MVVSEVGVSEGASCEQKSLNGCNATRVIGEVGTLRTHGLVPRQVSMNHPGWRGCHAPLLAEGWPLP